MKQAVITVLVILFGLVLGGSGSYFTYSSLNNRPTDSPSSSPDKVVVAEPDRPIGGESEDSEANVVVEVYQNFTDVQYRKALVEKDIILLYFCSEKDPICAVETPDIRDGLEDLKDNAITGFYIDFKNEQVESDEKDLAERYDVTSQHTKIILVDGEEEVRATDVWTPMRFKEAMQISGNE